MSIQVLIYHSTEIYGQFRQTGAEPRHAVFNRHAESLPGRKSCQVGSGRVGSGRRRPLFGVIKIHLF